MASWSVADSRKKVAQAFRNLVDEFRSFGAEYSSCYESAIAQQLDKLQQIDGLAPTDKKRISITIEDAARCHLSRQWRSFFGEAIKYRFRIQIMTTAAATVVAIPVLIGLIVLLPKPSLSRVRAVPTIRGSHINLAVLIFFLLFVVAMYILVRFLIYVRSRVPYRFKPFGAVFCAVIPFVVLVIVRKESAYVFSAWNSGATSFSLIHGRLKHQMALVPVPQMLQVALFVIGIGIIVIIITRFINFCGKEATRRKAYSEAAAESADVILSLLYIGDLIAALMAPIQAASTDVKNYPKKRGRATTPAWNASWRALDFQLEELASQIAGRWQKAMRSCYGSAGEQIANEAPRIELFIRNQQAKNCLLSSNLFELRDTIAMTLTHAADGNWHMIGAGEECSSEIITHRRIKLLRRAIIVGLSISSAITAAHFLPRYPELAITCGVFALTELLTLLDPDGPTLLDVAGRIAATLKRGG